MLFILKALSFRVYSRICIENLIFYLGIRPKNPMQLSPLRDLFCATNNFKMNEFWKQPMPIPMSRSSTESSAYSEDSSSTSLRSPSPQRSLQQHKCTADKRIVEILEDYIADNNTTPDKMYQWLLANQNTLQYKSILAFLLKMGLGCEIDLKKSFNLLLTAARKDYMIAEEMVGDFYYTGMGTNEDEVMAFNWYHKTADKGSAYGYHGLGYCYEYGKGTKKCTKKALDCYETSAKMGNIWGMIDLAKMYQKGIGTTKNSDKAIYWYQKAYANGCEKAKNELDKLTNNKENNKLESKPKSSKRIIPQIIESKDENPLTSNIFTKSVEVCDSRQYSECIISDGIELDFNKNNEKDNEAVIEDDIEKTDDNFDSKDNILSTLQRMMKSSPKPSEGLRIGVQDLIKISKNRIIKENISLDPENNNDDKQFKLWELLFHMTITMLEIIEYIWID
ncbi:12017_t:CDS:2 [Diversispora eburnea]|uniref:12017_t:CDS:1 n=1 Tax=Diversispora eburnea TaxID=1213867 RepID=A0A9N9AS76_9GLOM|nr:12017_t:CDS:2 [Diversispora eburnea]